jgi:hypothetical protein
MNGILLTESYDLQIKVERNSSGLITQGLVIWNIDYQRCRLILKARKGEIKEYPTLGFGIDQYQKAVANTQKFVNDLQTELKSDGFANPKVTVTSDLKTFDVEI